MSSEESSSNGAVLTEFASNRAVVLRNVTCAYCGCSFEGELSPTKEHVIGRRFVPKGSLRAQWNLILNVCEGCNREKGVLEDDISAITMMPDAWGRYAVDDERLREEVARKAVNSRSRRTGKTVAESQEELAIDGSFGSLSFTVNLIGPAQVESERLFRLARFQFEAFVYFTTYNAETLRGSFVSGVFCPLVAAQRLDWGAPHLQWFMDVTRSWEARVHGIGADGFYKVMIRRNPSATVWSWVTEWNRSYRVAGFAGEEAEIRSLLATLPAQRMEIVRQTETERIRMRLETELPAEADDLFTVSRPAEGFVV